MNREAENLKITNEELIKLLLEQYRFDILEKHGIYTGPRFTVLETVLDIIGFPEDRREIPRSIYKNFLDTSSELQLNAQIIIGLSDVLDFMLFEKQKRSNI